MIQHVTGVGCTVSDMARLLPFYTQVLPFEIATDIEVMGEPWERLTGVFGARLRIVTLTLGSEQFQLWHYLAPPGGRPIPPDSRSNDHWFQHIAIVVSDIDAAYTRLRAAGVQHVSSAPQTLPATIPAAAGVRAFYFRDPDGHNLELIQFPADKGAARWQRTDALFLGIDHTAIGIGSTARSLSFYRDLLGLTVAGASQNFGTEQEHLNMVFGAHLQITGLTAPGGGPGVEFLAYLAPPGGRPMPADTRPNDLWHWQITMTTSDLDALAATLAQHGIRPISAGIVELPGGLRGLLMRDPDGHTLQIITQPASAP